MFIYCRFYWSEILPFLSVTIELQTPGAFPKDPGPRLRTSGPGQVTVGKQRPACSLEPCLSDAQNSPLEIQGLRTSAFEVPVGEQSQVWVDHCWYQTLRQLSQQMLAWPWWPPIWKHQLLERVAHSGDGTVQNWLKRQGCLCSVRSHTWGWGYGVEPSLV